jgi:CubicO group peptidase (beta-lactamase class C family)
MVSMRICFNRCVCIPLTALIFLWAAALTPAEAKSPQRDYWPTEKWRVSTPEAEGMDSQELLKIIPFIINNLPDIQSLLVVRNGYLVFENYFGLGMPDRYNTVHSVTKSVTSALVGIARSQGMLTDLNRTMPEFFPEYFDDRTVSGKRKITLKHLLTMTAGLKSIKVKDWGLLLQWNFAPDRVGFTLNLPLIHPPGQVFDYSNSISHLLSTVLTERSGLSLWEFAHRNLFGPIGINPSVWKQDARGYYSGHGSLYLTPREMAKFGFLYLNRGRWDGKQIVPADWIAESTRAQVKAGQNYDYGYQWWIRPVAGCPSYRAWGRNGQFIVVIPELDLVIVVTSRTGLPGRASGHYSPLFDIVAQAVVDKNCRRKIDRELVISNPADLPWELRDFLDRFAQAVESKEIHRIISFYSDGFLHSGRDKSSLAGTYRLLTGAVNNFQIRVDQCRINDVRAKLFGEIVTNMGPSPLNVSNLIKENGSWKWYGNQKER